MTTSSMQNLPQTLFDPVDSIQAAFEAFDREYPQVYALFTRYANQARKAGHSRYSADAILHRIRWHHNIENPVKDDFGVGSTFKINDHFSSRYARKLIDDDPTFYGFFILKGLKRR